MAVAVVVEVEFVSAISEMAAVLATRKLGIFRFILG